MANRVFGFLFIITVFLLTGCASMAPAATETLTETATPSPTATITVTPTLTPTVTSTPTLTPTLEGGGSGKLLFQGFLGDYPDGQISILGYDLQIDEISVILKDFVLVSISPDGKQLLVSEYTAGQPTFDHRSPYPLYIVNSDGSNLRLFSTGFNNFYGKASWLTGTDLIVFTQQEDGVIKLLLSHPDGTIEQIAQTNQDAMDFIETSFKGGIIWKDGEYYGNGSVKFAGHQYNWSGLNGEDTIILPNNLTEIKVSPNGEHFAYNTPYADSEIYITSELDGSNSIELRLEDRIEDPSSGLVYIWGYYFWYPDGQRLLCSIYSCSNSVGECSSTKKVVFSNEGEFIKAYQQDWSYLSYAPDLWSPDGRLFLAPGFNGSSGWTILDSETMEAVYIVPDISSEEFGLMHPVDWLP